MSAEPVLFTDYEGLDKYENRATRTDTFATISAGFKGANGAPVVSRDGTIHISDPEGRAAGLAAALKAKGGKRLVIAMPSNNPKHFISESFRIEGKTRLEAFGDAAGFTVIKPDGGHVHYEPGTPEFAQLRERAKVSTSILFLLAEYDKDGRPLIVYPDGMGLYRLRTTSPNTRDNLMSQLKQIAQLTGGHIAGFPLEVSLAYRNLTGPKGDKRNCPVFTFALKPPTTMKLDSRAFVQIAIAAKESMAIAPQMMLPEARETLEMAIADFDEPPPSCLTTGLNPEQFRRRFFAVCKGTHMDTDERRKAFMVWHTAQLDPQGTRTTKSLAKFLDGATLDEAEALFDALTEAVDRSPFDFETGEQLPDLAPTPAAFVGEAFGMEMPIDTTAYVVEPGLREPTDEELANQPPLPRKPVADQDDDYDFLPGEEEDL
jgi:hypothetical protein